MDRSGWAEPRGGPWPGPGLPAAGGKPGVANRRSVTRSAERPGAGAQRTTQTGKQAGEASGISGGVVSSVPLRRAQSVTRSARAVMGSGVRRERREKPDRFTRGPGRVFPQSYGLDRVAHRRGVTRSAADWTRGRVAFAAPPDTNSRAAPAWFVSVPPLQAPLRVYPPPFCSSTTTGRWGRLNRRKEGPELPRPRDTTS